MIFNLLLPSFNFLNQRALAWMVKVLFHWPEHKFVQFINGVEHEIGNLKHRDYFIWETSLHFANDVIIKWVKHIPSEMCLCHINISICGMLLATRGADRGFSEVTLTVSAMPTERWYKPEYTASVLCLLMTIFVRLASACAWTRLQLDFCNSKDSGFTKPMIYCVITTMMTNAKLSMHFAKPAAFVLVPLLVFPLLIRESHGWFWQQDTQGA